MNNNEKKDVIKQILYNNKYDLTPLNKYTYHTKKTKKNERRKKITKHTGKIYKCW
jgi:hypothetical protein